ncbi:MAG: DUF1956 domain-containing protein [Methyloprofundus sp.]|nr:DUF1956 domain-containing protein [Methyloprofundus sp.]
MDSKEQVLQAGLRLFSRNGFDNVSLRDVAKSAKVGTFATYRFFPNKQSLYLGVMRFAFAKQASSFNAVWDSGLSNEKKLSEYILCLAQTFTSDSFFRRLMQRELLDANEERLQLLANEVLSEQFNHLVAVIEALDNQRSAHFSALSVIALVCNLIQMNPLNRHLLGWKKEHETPEYIAKQAVNLILAGLLPQ